MTDHYERADALTTMHDVAREAGVSVSTVSRALRNDQTVAEETQRRVRLVAAKLDYRLNSNASRLRRGITQTVAIAIPALNSWYTSQLMAGAHEILNAEGYDTVVTVASSADAVDRTLGLADQRFGRFDGVIVVDMALTTTMVDDLRDTGTSVVTTGRALPFFSSVMIDDIAIARRATAHLIGLGHERIGLITGNSGGPYQFAVTERRRTGYFEAMTAAGFAGTNCQAAGNFALEGGYEAAVQLFKREPNALTALFCMSDEMAVGALHALRDLGLSVPNDVSVIGIDDHEIAEPFGLTTMRQPVREFGTLAASLMVERLRTGDVSISHKTLETEMVVRRTTRKVGS